ncbi:CotY/CotZ family spore coat protein [Lederbergia citrea]|uniref:Spore coat protein n=1 Tax=Lederbergia citrea TaxID=2833581 RepID=A0A942UND7_9BACI|nr:CotY/CotZ family spore coat protein [Lederbergia citrea]MBS4222071.1 hypothetical protein [Lederbergia citrea]
MDSNDKHHDICKALAEIKKLQDFIVESKTPYFGNLLARIVDADTIPFLLQTNEGFLGIMGSHEVNGEKEYFFTKFFRIESINMRSCSATISLLLPIDIHGNTTDSIDEVMILRKTSIRREIDLSGIFAIQALDTKFLKRKIIIQPKW